MNFIATRFVEIVLTWIFLFASLNAAFAADEPTVRVRLFELTKINGIQVSSESGLTLFAGDYRNPLGKAAPGEVLQIEIVNGELATSFGEIDLRALSLTVKPDPGHSVRIQAGLNSNQQMKGEYPGFLSIKISEEKSSEMLVINQVDLEDYVAGVLPNEYGFGDREGLKAMSIVIRTYALRSAGKFGPDFDHVDHVSSQVYKGTHRVTPDIKAIVEETRGQVLTYNGELIDAVYFASSGGQTANNEDVWLAEPIPYLRGKNDPYHNDPHLQWNSRIARSELVDHLSRNYGIPVQGFHIGKRSEDGRVSSITLLLRNGEKKEVRGNDFRLVVNKKFGHETLKSTNFTTRLEGNDYLVEGIGRGHGVGMSQWGAHEMALNRYDYRDILSFYYSDVVLETRGDAAKSVLTASINESKEVVALEKEEEPEIDSTVPAPTHAQTGHVVELERSRPDRLRPTARRPIDVIETTETAETSSPSKRLGW